MNVIPVYLLTLQSKGGRKKHEKSEMKKITREEAIGGETQTGKTLSLTKDTLKTSQIAK